MACIYLSTNNSILSYFKVWGFLYLPFVPYALTDSIKWLLFIMTTLELNFLIINHDQLGFSRHQPRNPVALSLAVENGTVSVGLKLLQFPRDR